MCRQAMMIETGKEQTVLIMSEYVYMTVQQSMHVFFKYVCRNRHVHVYDMTYHTYIHTYKDAHKLPVDHTS